jgi:flagellar FliL protein
MTEASPGIPNPAQEAASDPGTPRLQKVELDLDDAPFLKADEPTPVVEEKAPEAEKAPRIQRAKPWYKRPLPLLISGIMILLAALGAVLLFSASREPKPPNEPPIAPPPVVEVVENIPPPAPPPPQFSPPEPIPHPQRFLVNLDSFLVLIQGEEGTRLLTLKFSVHANDITTHFALEEQELHVRNVLYDFLRSQNEENLTRPGAANMLRPALHQALTTALPDGSFGDIFIEELLVQ